MFIRLATDDSLFSYSTFLLQCKTTSKSNLPTTLHTDLFKLLKAKLTRSRKHWNEANKKFLVSMSFKIAFIFCCVY